VTWLGASHSLQDPNKPSLERSLSTFDIHHVVQFSYTYDCLGRHRALLGTCAACWRQSWAAGRRTASGRIADGATDNPDPCGWNGAQLWLTAALTLSGRQDGNRGSNWVDNYFVIPACSSVRPTIRWARASSFGVFDAVVVHYRLVDCEAGSCRK